MSHQQAGRKDEFIVRPERVTGCIHFVEQDARQETAAAETSPGLRYRLLSQGLLTYIYTPDLGFVFGHFAQVEVGICPTLQE